MPKKTIEFRTAITNEEFEQICSSELKNVPRSTLEKDADGFFIEEKTDLLSGTYGVKAYVKYVNGSVCIDAKCGGMGIIQQKHVNEVAEIIQNLIQRAIENPQAMLANDNIVRCPKCGSSQIQLEKRGWSLATGFIGSGKNERVCMKCLYKF